MLKGFCYLHFEMFVLWVKYGNFIGNYFDNSNAYNLASDKCIVDSFINESKGTRAPMLLPKLIRQLFAILY